MGLYFPLFSFFFGTHAMFSCSCARFAWEFNSHHWVFPPDSQLLFSCWHEPQSACCLLHSAGAQAPKIIYICGRNWSSFKARTTQLDFRMCWVGGGAERRKDGVTERRSIGLAEAVKTFRVPSTVCPFSACLSPAGHENGCQENKQYKREKKRQRATKFSFNWTTGAAIRQQHANNSHVFGFGCCPVSQTVGAAVAVFVLATNWLNRLMYY